MSSSHSPMPSLPARNARTIQRRPLRPLAWAVQAALLGLSLAQLPTPVQAQQASAGAAALIAADIPAGPLGQVLSQFAAQAGVPLLFVETMVEGVQSRGVRGQVTVQQGFAQALGGTGYELVMRDGGYGLRKSATDGVAALETVTVSGALEATSEGSGSYAARAATVFKGAQSLREIPQSLSVMTRQQIEDRGWTTTEQALQQVTGVIVSGYEGQQDPSIRGYSANVQADGVAIQSSYQGTGNNTIAQYDRIEVLRGPSALLSGTGEPGGTVNYVRKRPTQEFAFSGAARLGSWQQRGADLDVSGPLAADGRLRGRAVLSYDDKNSFYETWFSRYALFYGALEYDLTPNTTLGVTTTYGHRKWIVSWGLPRYTDGSLPGRDAYVGPDKPSSHKSPELSLDVTHRFAQGWQAKLTYNYNKASIEQYGFYNAPIDLATGLSTRGSTSYLDESRTFQGGDAYVTGPFRVLGRTHELTVGFNMSQRDYRSGQAYVSVPPHRVLQEHGYEYGTPASRSQSVTKQSGLYAAARFSLTDDLKLILGSRWSKYSSKSRNTWPAQTAWNVSSAEANNEFTPYGGVVWDFHPSMTWYASYADTFVPQSNFDYQGRVLDPRIGWQAETGIKGEFLDGRLNATLAVFYLEDKNRSMVDDEHVGCGGTAAGTCYRNAGKVQNKGVELEVTGSPLDGWDISAGYTWNRSKIVADSNAANIGAPVSSRTPVHLFKLWTQYRFNSRDFGGALLGWTVGAGINVQSDTYSGIYTQGGYATASAKIGYQVSPHWSMDLIVENVFDRNYLRQLGSAGFNNFYGAPRSFMLNSRWRY